MKKVILISGGSDGFGKALAAHFAKTHTVVILARDEDKTAAAAHEIVCDFVAADVSDHAQVQKAVTEVVAKHGQIDVLINNAGLWIEGPLESNGPERIATVMAVNATGTILLTRTVLPLMKAVRSGRIINVISQAGLYGKAERAVYHASKWAITGFTKSLSAELKGSGIGVTGFYPAPCRRDRLRKRGTIETYRTTCDSKTLCVR